MSLSEQALDAAREQAATLANALPYLRRYAGDTIVVKYGGHAMGDAALSAAFGHDIALLKLVGVNPVVVHGGGPQINAMLERLAIKSSFVDGLRVTDAAMVEIIEMVLSGSVNKRVAELINRAGALAVGISGKDGAMIRAPSCGAPWSIPTAISSACSTSASSASRSTWTCGCWMR